MRLPIQIWKFHDVIWQTRSYCTKMRGARAARLFLIQPIKSLFQHRRCRCRRRC